MSYNFATIDITKQLVRLTMHPTFLTEQAWFTDLVCRSMHWLGLLDISFETDEPSNTRKLWFDAGNPPTGAPGVLKIFDGELDDWVKLTRANFYLYEARLARPVWWFTSKLATGTVRPPDNEVTVGDYWEHDVGTDNEISIYRQLGPNYTAWVDLTGGEIDESLITGYVSSGMARATRRAATISAATSGTFYGQDLYVEDTARWYKWTPSPDRWQDAA